MDRGDWGLLILLLIAFIVGFVSGFLFAVFSEMGEQPINEIEVYTDDGRVRYIEKAWEGCYLSIGIMDIGLKRVSVCPKCGSENIYRQDVTGWFCREYSLDWHYFKEPSVRFSIPDVDKLINWLKTMDMLDDNIYIANLLTKEKQKVENLRGANAV